MRRVAFALLAASLGSIDAGATVLYKLTDRVGNVTYVDMVPRAFDGKVTRLDIDSDAKSVAPADIPRILSQAPAPAVSYLETRRSAEAANEARVRAARARVDAARAALGDAQDNSTPDDWIYLARNNPAGPRRIPRPEYAERLQGLEADVLVAQDELARAERDLR